MRMIHIELYNLKMDISEKENLAETQKERALSLQKELQEWLCSCAAKMPVYNPDYKEIKY